MRELRFRVWDKAFDTMEQNVQDNRMVYHMFENDDRFVIMQFMNMKDIKGIEIYEDDIVMSERTPDQPIKGGYLGIKPAEKIKEYRVVKFNITEEEIKFILPKDISYSERHSGNELKWEVVGNIYQTPELVQLCKE